MKKFLHSAIISAAITVGMTNTVTGTAMASTPSTDHTNTATQVQISTAQPLNFSPLFIELSDAMSALKNGDDKSAIAHLQVIKIAVSAMPMDTAHAHNINTALDAAISTPTDAQLSVVSTALYAAEQAQNPVDHDKQRHKFAEQILPAYDKMLPVLHAMTPQDPASVDAARRAYAAFNSVWLSNERMVRKASMAHYGGIETAMALMRVAIESTPANTELLSAQTDALKVQLDSFISGQAVQTQAQTMGLADATQLLKQGLSAFQNHDQKVGLEKIAEFIRVWSGVEGQVSTRNPSLYGRIESQLPIVMAHGDDPKQQAVLSDLIAELDAINPTTEYTAIDAMLILLREGLEALLIVVALLSALSVAKQSRGKAWVYAGVASGLIASVLAAIALQSLLPATSSGAGREVFEGVIGIIAVVMMIGIGAWLHSKSSVQSWNAFIKRHMGQALTTGSFVGLFGLSFLSVFREGAETLLFYVGILPNISMTNFLLGIMLALVVLMVVAFVMLKTSAKLPIPKLFAILTWVIYFLGFKILGVSILALQLTNHLPRHVLFGVPAIEWVGFYPTLESIGAQLLYAILIIALQYYLKYKTHAAAHA